MGSRSGEPNEQPIHRVELAPYRIGKYEVTNEQFAAFARAQGVSFPKLSTNVLRDPKVPVVSVSWYDAERFCQWMTQRGRRYSLPTEAQWEFAARGKDGRRYPWGDVLGPQEGYRCNRGGKFDGFELLAPVGRFSAGISPYGLHDCAGNAAEWCLDWYSSVYYAGAPMTEPAGPERTGVKVVRGGSYETMALEDLRCTARSWVSPESKSPTIGFRVVCEP